MVGSTPSGNPEYPPILAVGRHILGLEELERICVNEFPLSSTRKNIMDGFIKVASLLRLVGIYGEIWVNGSFLTIKLNPNDVDFVIRIKAEMYDNGTKEQKEVINWINTNLKDTYKCDSYVFAEWPEGHKLYWRGQYMHNYWMKQFGFSRGVEMKGIAVIELGQGLR